MNENKAIAIMGYIGLASVIGVTFGSALVIPDWSFNLVRQVIFIVAILALLFIALWHELLYKKEKVQN